MNTSDFKGMLISKRDYFALPPSMRQMSDGPMVLATMGGRQTFVRALIIEWR